MEVEGSDTSRYRLIIKVATGGMATVWVGAVRGGLGFRQLVAIKKPHPHLLELPSLRNELVSEARLASMIQHGNVVDVRDVDVDGDQVNLVMDYIEGGSLADLVRAAKNEGSTLPPRVVLRIILDACAGLHAAHELVDESGAHVALVHRDVSPQNILVGLDGISRVTDFGIAKLTRSAGEKTDAGLVKGKLSYMSPEYIANKGFDRRLDVFALGTVCWEALAGERCFKGDSDVETANRIIRTPARILSKVAPHLGTALDDVLATAMERRPDKRFPTTRAFATALESAGAAMNIGTHAEVGASVAALVGAELDERRATVRAALKEHSSLMSMPAIVTPRAAEVQPSDSRSSEAVAISSVVPDFGDIPLPSDGEARPETAAEAETTAEADADADADALRASLTQRRRPLTLVVAAVCGVSLFVLVIAVALSSRAPPVRASSSQVAAGETSSVAEPAPPSEREAIPSPIPPAPSEQPEPPIIELPAAASVASPVTAPRPVVAPRPSAVRAPGTVPSTRPSKPVPPNPYGH